MHQELEQTVVGGQRVNSLLEYAQTHPCTESSRGLDFQSANILLLFNVDRLVGFLVPIRETLRVRVCHVCTRLKLE
jgi:hypothetical protein